MSEAKKIYDLEKRTKQFGLEVRDFCRPFKKDIINSVYINQIIRSSSSIGANYIEANEKLGEKDLLFRIKITRKEAKETIFWLHHFNKSEERDFLVDEAEQLRKIFSSILTKLTLNNINN
jgi:four helix bundle protein